MLSDCVWKQSSGFFFFLHCDVASYKHAVAERRTSRIPTAALKKVRDNIFRKCLREIKKLLPECYFKSGSKGSFDYLEDRLKSQRDLTFLCFILCSKR